MNNIKNREYFLVRSKKTNINVPLDLPSNVFYDNICVTSCSVPKTFYVFNNDCTLQVNENGTVRSITFSKGNYNVRSFKTIFKTKTDSICTYIYNITYPDINTEVDDGKFTFTVTGNSGIQPTFKTSDLYLSKVMGIEKDVEYGFVGGILKSVNILSFQSYDEILIKSGNVMNRESILQEIYSNADMYNNSISWSNPDLLANAKNLNKLNSNSFNFSLQNAEGDYIDLNGQEWSMVICIFSSSNYEQVVKDYIKMRVFQDEKKALEQV